MKKFIFTAIFTFSILFSGNLIAQDYNSSVGVRLAFGLTATYKKEFKENTYLELYGGFGYHTIFGGGALEIHKEIEDVDHLYWYYGAGAFAGYYSSNLISDNYFYMGINGVIGVDYSFEEIPLNVSVDWMPGFRLVGGFTPTFLGGGLSARYILSRN